MKLFLFSRPVRVPPFSLDCFLLEECAGSNLLGIMWEIIARARTGRPPANTVRHHLPCGWDHNEWSIRTWATALALTWLHQKPFDKPFKSLTQKALAHMSADECLASFDHLSTWAGIIITREQVSEHEYIITHERAGNNAGVVLSADPL